MRVVDEGLLYTFLVCVACVCTVLLHMCIVLLHMCVLNRDVLHMCSVLLHMCIVDSGILDMCSVFCICVLQWCLFVCSRALILCVLCV